MKSFCVKTSEFGSKKEINEFIVELVNAGAKLYEFYEEDSCILESMSGYRDNGLSLDYDFIGVDDIGRTYLANSLQYGLDTVEYTLKEVYEVILDKPKKELTQEETDVTQKKENKEGVVYFKVLDKSCGGPFRDTTVGKIYIGHVEDRGDEGKCIYFEDDIGSSASFLTHRRSGKFKLVKSAVKSQPRYHRPRVKPPVLKRNKLLITYADGLGSQYTLKDVITVVVKANVVSITYKNFIAGFESRVNMDIPVTDIKELEHKTPKGKTTLIFKNGLVYQATNKTIQL